MTLSETAGSRFFVGWTPERVVILKKLIGRSLSAAEIACELGGITRNAVIGKVLRLGLELPGRRIALTPEQIEARREAKMAKRRARRSKYGHQNVVRAVKEVRQRERLSSAERKQQQLDNHAIALQRRDKIAFMAANELTDLPPEDAAAAVTFDGLTGNNCRWPIGDPRSLETIKFCGKGIAKGPYCAHHHRTAHQ